MNLPNDPALTNLVQKQNISLTADQSVALNVFSSFLRDERPFCSMVLRGAAGTGKTFLLDIFTKHMKKLGWQVFLLAPTGRAAKVMTRRAKKYASTLHRHIYHPEEGPNGIYFELKENDDEEKVCYILDEASMLGGGSGKKTGSNLLDDLIGYAYQDSALRKVIFSGDPAQLPPVGHTHSPALSTEILRDSYRLNVYDADLSEIMRQAAHSEILVCAGEIRSKLGSAELPKVTPPTGRDVVLLENAEEAMEIFLNLYDSDDPDKVVIITFSNFYATRINLSLRARLFDTEEELMKGERLLVVKNNYSHKENNFPFIANGEPCTIKKVFTDRKEERYGLKWIDAEVEFFGFDDQPIEVECKIVLDLLTGKQANLSFAEMQKVIAGRMEELDSDPIAKKNTALKKDPYLTALQVKYGYAITGHKAQGGQWKNVIVAFEPLYKGVEMQDYLRWTYTALTRAEEKLFLLGWPFGSEG